MKRILSKMKISVVTYGILATSLVYAGDGHDAGYRWAEQHDIRDIDYSNGNSESFNEGVREYAEEMVAEEGEE